MLKQEISKTRSKQNSWWGNQTMPRNWKSKLRERHRNYLKFWLGLISSNLETNTNSHLRASKKKRTSNLKTARLYTSMRRSYMNKENIKMPNQSCSPWKKSLWTSNKRTQTWCFKFSGDFLLARFWMEKEEMLLNIPHSRRCENSLRRNSILSKVAQWDRSRHRWSLGSSTGS